MEKKKENVTSKEETESQKIWNEIKDKPIEMFALPNQMVNQYCKYQEIDPDKLFVLPTATSVLPALEAALGSKYNVEMSHKYIVVTRAK